MNVSVLVTLRAILDHGSFAAAAAEVGCSPSAVSLQVRQLEQYFGRPLFDRSGRQVQPTPFARELGRWARECVAHLEALRARPAMAITGRFRLGAIASAQTDALPVALRQLRERHPTLHVGLTIEDSDQLLRALKAARIDGAVVVRPVGASGSRGLHWTPLALQPFVLLTPPDAPAATPRRLFARYGWIRYDPQLTGGKAAARFVRRICPEASVRMDVRAIDAIVAMVAEGIGVSVVPRPRAALLQAHAVRALALGRESPQRRIAFVCRAPDAESRNGLAVLEALRTAYAVGDAP